MLASIWCKRKPRNPAQPDRPATEDAKWDKHTANLNSIYAEEKAVDKLRSRRLQRLRGVGMMDNDKQGKLVITTAADNVDTEAAYRREQEMLDDAMVRTIIRAIKRNPDLRREMLAALGLNDESEATE